MRLTCTGHEVYYRSTVPERLTRETDAMLRPYISPRRMVLLEFAEAMATDLGTAEFDRYGNVTFRPHARDPEEPERYTGDTPGWHHPVTWR